MRDAMDSRINLSASLLGFVQVGFVVSSPVVPQFPSGRQGGGFTGSHPSGCRLESSGIPVGLFPTGRNFQVVTPIMVKRVLEILTHPQVSHGTDFQRPWRVSVDLRVHLDF